MKIEPSLRSFYISGRRKNHKGPNLGYSWPRAISCHYICVSDFIYLDISKKNEVMLVSDKGSNIIQIENCQLWIETQLRIHRSRGIVLPNNCDLESLGSLKSLDFLDNFVAFNSQKSKIAPLIQIISIFIPGHFTIKAILFFLLFLVKFLSGILWAKLQIFL